LTKTVPLPASNGPLDFEAPQHVQTFSTWRRRLSALRTDSPYALRNIPTPWPYSGWKVEVNEKFQWSHRTHDLQALQQCLDPTAPPRSPTNW